MSAASYLQMSECQYCGKIVSSRFRRACCENHSPLGDAIWVEFYGPEGWMSQSKCYADETCGVPYEPNGGFVCQSCFERLCIGSDTTS